MRRKLCFGVLLLCSIIFGLFSSDCSDVSAYSYEDVQYKAVTGASLIYNNGGHLDFVTTQTGGAYWAGSGVNNTSGYNYLSISFSGNMPGRCFILLGIKTQAPLGTYPQTSWGVRSSRYTVVEQSFGEYGMTFVTIYTDGTFSGTIDLTPTGLTANAQSLDIQVSPIYIVTMVKPPTESQISGIATTLNSVFADLDVMNATMTTLNTNATNILYELRSLSSDTERTADAVEEQNEKDDEDRSNIESQSSDIDSGASDSSDDATDTGTSLLGAFSAFITALTSATPSNCNIDMDLGNLDLGVVNLCQLSLPQPFPTIASIMLILFCVPLSISTARKVINLFRSFQ